MEKNINDPTKGLPEDIFYFIGRITPFVNIDLLIQCPENGSLLTWRDDVHTGKGWHIPGGIIRFREKFDKRVREVAKKEVGIEIKNFDGPFAINEIISNKKERSHFISLLFISRIKSSESRKILKIMKNDKKIKFFKNPPKGLLKWHDIYRKFLQS